MSSTIFDLGTRKVYPSGYHSSVLVIPKQWTADQSVRIKDKVFFVVGLNGDVRIFKSNEGREDWVDTITVRAFNNHGKIDPAITVTAKMRRQSGIAIGDVVGFTADTDDGSLIIRKGG